MDFQGRLSASVIFLDLEKTTKAEIIEHLCRELAAARKIADADLAITLVLEREGLRTTSVGNGIALPHARIDGQDTLVIAAARPKTPLAWDASGAPVNLVFLLVSPRSAPEELLRTLSFLARRLGTPEIREELGRTTEPERFLDLIQGDASDARKP